MKKLILCLLLSTANAAEVKIHLQEKGTKKPLVGVSVFVLPQKLKFITDKDGNVTAKDLPKNENISWVINSSGYLKLQIEDKITQDSEDKDFYLEKSSYQVFETTIYDKEDKRDSSKKSLKREEFLKAPGSAGDPLRAVQNLPGVNRPQSLSSQVIIQGSGPQETAYLLNDHNVPLVFHFGGLSSILIPEAVDRVDLFTAGFGPEYGRATGGLLGAWTRKPRRDRLHGVLFADTINAGVLFEGPIGKNSGFILGVRQSYIGQVLRFVLKNNENFDLTVAPSYGDFTALFDSDLTEKDSFQILNFASRDGLEFLLKEPVKTNPGIRGNFETGTSFFRVIPQWTHRFSNSSQLKFSLGAGRDFIKILNADNFFRLKTIQLTSRAELEKEVTSHWKTYLGFDHQYIWSDVDLNLPVFYSAGGVSNPFGSGDSVRTTVSERRGLLGFYARNEVKLGSSAFTLLPNFRIDHFSVTDETYFSPRPGIRYALSDSTTLRTAGGLYYQPPQPQETDRTVGNPDVKSSYAWHAVLGIDQDFRNGSTQGITLTSDVFYKRLRRLVTRSSAFKSGTFTPEYYNNNSEGNVVGWQSQFKLKTGRWNFSTIYTLSQSRRSQPGNKDRPSAYDQTHLLGLLGSIDLPENWSFSARFRYSTGNPITPVVDSVYDADNDVYIPIRGTYYSSRLPAFYQLDVRVDKKWIFNTWILSAYLDILNATNRQNQESILYSYDYRKTSQIQGIPILPTIGLKAEF